MGVAVNLDEKLIKVAKVYSSAQSRSVAKQIEHWAKIGRIAEDNPELSYGAIRAILLGLEDVKHGNLEEYDPDEL